MSSLQARKSRRRELLNRMWDLGRTMSTQTVFLHQAIAQGVGLNATDTKCIDLILGGPDGSITAGWLSQRSGLTTGAVTHILDRLEKHGFIERIRDAKDRRKVFIRIRPEKLKPLLPKYEAVGKAYMSLLEQYDDQELELICGYLGKVSEMSGRGLADIIAARSAGSSRTKRASASSDRRDN
jgi:DNA-binding MarR family transcriptional regulator